MRRKEDPGATCGVSEAAHRLGISVDEVLHLIESGTLPAVRFMGDDRWFVPVAHLDRVAPRFRPPKPGLWERLRGRDGAARRPQRPALELHTNERRGEASGPFVKDLPDAS